MYKFKLMLKDKHTRAEAVRTSNNIQSLITEVNKLKNVSFVIFKNHNNSIMLKGSK